MGIFTRHRISDGTPQFPRKQLFVLAICRLCEPIAFMSIFPYVYFMVQHFQVAKTNDGIAFYAGMITSSFAFAEFATNVLWGRLSDRVGRKPVLICGLAGTGVSMLVFGFAPNFWTALVARAMGGLLNGNIGVINTTVAEIITDKSQQARAFSIMPGIWCIGIIGAAIGGTLANPVQSYPGSFAPDGLFAQYPYLLPNLVCCAVVVCSMSVGMLFLEETHEDMKYRRDYGIEFRERLLSFGKKMTPSCDEKQAVRSGDYERVHSSEQAHDLERPSLEELTPRPSDVSGDLQKREDASSLEAGIVDDKTKSGATKAFTGRVITIIVCYGILAFHTITAEQLLPVMLSLPRSSTPPSLPFLFEDGFELSTKHIGQILSSQGIIQAIAGIIIFPMLSRRLGALGVFRLSCFTYPLFYLVVPYITVLPETLRMPALYVVIVWKVCSQAWALPPVHILIANSAPSKKVLGTLNGTAASSASLCRALGPTLSGLIQSAGLAFGCLGLPWWTSSAIAVIGAALCMTLKEPQDSMEDMIITERAEPAA